MNISDGASDQHRPTALVDYIVFRTEAWPSQSVMDWMLNVCADAGLEPTPIGRPSPFIKLKARGILLAHDPAHGDVRVEIKGEGCRELERASGFSWCGFLGECLERGAKFTRLDLALDDRRHLLCLDDILACHHAGEVGGRIGVSAPIEQKRAERIVARGLQVGNSRSDALVRIYDKALQQREQRRYRGEPAGEGDDGHWIRVELQLRGRRSHEAAGLVARDGAGVVAGLLASALDFKKASRNQQKRRWPTRDWWKAFLAGAAKARLATAPARPAEERFLEYAHGQLAAKLAWLVDEHPEWWTRILAEGRRRNEVRTARKFNQGSMSDGDASPQVTSGRGKIGTDEECGVAGAKAERAALPPEDDYI